MPKPENNGSPIHSQRLFSIVVTGIMEDSTDSRIRAHQPEISPLRMDSMYRSTQLTPSYFPN